MNKTESPVDRLYADPSSLGSRLRARRVGPLVQLISDAHARYGHVRLLDVGGRKGYWSILPPDFLRQHDVKVELLNLSDDIQGEDDDIFEHVVGDACNLEMYSDKSFHIAHSNSVIEHVGGWGNVKRFASEIRRVASGLFVQTPNFWFPIEPHYMAPFIHWLPRPLQEVMVRRLPLGYFRRKEPDWDSAMACIDATPRLLNARAYRLLFPDCSLVKERFFMLPKSLIAVRPVS